MSDDFLRPHFKVDQFYTAWEMSKCGVISGTYFPVFGPEITPYLGTFHAVLGHDLESERIPCKEKY